MEAPRYRVRAHTEGPERGSNVRYIGSVPYFVGAEIDFGGWPNPGALEPINPAAKKITEFARRNIGNPTRPPSPFNQLLGRIYLPAEMPASHSARMGDGEGFGRGGALVPADKVVDGMPKWKIGFGGLSIGNKMFNAGDVITFLGWPLYGFEAANEAARLIADYLAKNSGNDAMFPSPWCWLNGLTLPDLPESSRRAPTSTPSKTVPAFVPRERVPLGDGKATWCP